MTDKELADFATSQAFRDLGIDANATNTSQDKLDALADRALANYTRLQESRDTLPESLARMLDNETRSQKIYPLANVVYAELPHLPLLVAIALAIDAAIGCVVYAIWLRVR